MTTRKISGWFTGAATVTVIVYAISKAVQGKNVGFQEIVAIGLLLMFYLNTITWGNKTDKDGILQEEELGQKITEKSSKISYFVLLFVLCVAVALDQLVHGTTNVFLLGALGLGMILLPFVEFTVSRKYL